MKNNEAIDVSHLGCTGEQQAKLATSLSRWWIPIRQIGGEHISRLGETLRVGFCKERKNLSSKSCYNKIIFFALAFGILICFGFPGCGDLDSGRNTDNEGESTQSGDLPFNETGYPVVNKKVTYEFFITGTWKDPNELAIPKLMEQKTNVHINWIVVPSSNLQEKKSMLFASGDLPDVFTNNTIGGGDIEIYGPQKIFAELNDLIYKYMPNFKKICADTYPSALAEITLPNGKIYSLPGITPYYRTGNGFYVNKKWLDKLNLKVPETINEFYQMLKLFKTSDLNGNGKFDEIPFTFQGWSFGEFMGSFGLPTLGFMVKDGKVINAAVHNEYKEGIKFISKLYREKLIDPEVFTQDYRQFTSKGMNEPTYGAFLAWRDSDVVGTENAKDYELIPPLKDSDGNRYWMGLRSDINISKTNFVITNKAKNPEVLVRWADVLMDPYYGVQVRRGAIGEVLKENTDGSLEIKEVPAKYKSYVDWWNATTIANLPYASSMKYDKKILEHPAFTEKYDQDKLYSKYMAEALPSFWYTQEDIEELGALSVVVDKYISESAARWISGECDIDSEWDSYLREMKQLGIEKYIYVIQRVYDRYLKGLKVKQ